MDKGKMNSAYLSLGSNEGNRAMWLQKALAFIAIKCGAIKEQSSVYRTAAWGITGQPDFLNMVIHVETPLNPKELLATILDIETIMGRHRTMKWGPRIIDIDILFFNDEIIALPGLSIPHPFIQERRFALLPMAEIAPQHIHPKLRRTIADLLTQCEDNLEVTISDETG